MPRNVSVVILFLLVWYVCIGICSVFHILAEGNICQAFILVINQLNAQNFVFQ